MLLLINFIYVQIKQEYLNCHCWYLFMWVLFILVHLLDKLVLELDPYLFTLLTVFSVSVLWVDFDLSNDLPYSDLIIMDVSTFLLDTSDLSILLTVSILFFAMVRVMASFTTLGFIPMPLFPTLTTVLVVVTNNFYISSKPPLVFLALILGLSDFFYKGPLIFEDIISLLDLIYLVNSKIKISF